MFLHKLRFLVEESTYIETLEAASCFFDNNSSKIKAYQLSRFNKIWKDAYNNIPFYTHWKRVNNLPDRICDITELQNWPILKKEEIRKYQELTIRETPPSGFSITSGSTGIPLKIPVWPSNATKQNMWIGRAANGYLPGQKTFLIWGHHHLHGKGITKIKNIIMRRVKDAILGYKRISAYDTSVKTMANALKKYNSYKPQLVIGYSSSILSFVRCNPTAKSVHSPLLILCTAGPLSEKEQEEIRHFFKAPLCMEYGSVECGVMGYTIANCDHYNVFWNTHLIQGVKDENGYVKNIVTTLTNRYFPLIRYDIGDYLSLSEKEDLDSIKEIKTISGRPTDIVTLKDGTSFFPMLIEACVEHISGIISHQLVIKDNQIEILLVALDLLSEKDFDSIYEKLYSIIPSLKKHTIKIHQVDELQRNAAGKTPLTIKY